MRLPILVFGPLALASCASITAVPLDASGQPDGTVKGIRYFLPKPYILVTELPVTPTPPASTTPTVQDSKGTGPQTGTAATPQASVPTAAATDTSFSASMTSYSIKLVYLPDFSHPMALQENSGLFGNVSLAPSLADGWMLTSLTSANDSGGSAALAAVASLVGGAIGGATTGGVSKAAGEAAQRTHTVSIPSELLGTKTTTTTRTVYATQPSWGRNVLPPGLYEFDLLPLYEQPSAPGNNDARKIQAGAGEIIGLKPVVFFCNEGPEVPVPRRNPTGGSMFDLFQTPCLHPPIDTGSN